QRHAHHRLVPEAVLDHRRSQRKSRRYDPVLVGHPASHDALARRQALLHDRSGDGESGDQRHRHAENGRHLRPPRRQWQGAHPQPRAGSAPSLRDDGHGARDEARGPLRHRRADARAVRPERAQDRAHDPMAEGRRAPVREHHVLAGREADVPVYRTGRADLRDEQLHAGRHVGPLAADRRRLRAHRVRIPCRVQRRPGLLHRPVQGVGSGAAPADDGNRPCESGGEDGGLLHARSCDAAAVRDGARAQSRVRALRGHRALRILEIRSGASQAGEPHRVQGASAHGPQDQLEREDPLHLRRGEHDRSLRRGDVSVSAHDYAGRGHDDRSLRLPRVRDGAEVVAVVAWGLRFIVPYWRRLALVLVRRLLSTAFSLSLPLLSRDFFDRALVGRDTATLTRVAVLFAAVTVLGFIANVASGLRYTRVSADILFDMRLEMYRHLQRLSPRFYARTRLGDVLSRINNDIGEIQRIASEAALAWFGNVLFLIGTIATLAWLDLRLFAITIVAAPLGFWTLIHYRGRLEDDVAALRQRSADIGSFLIETLQAARLVAASNAHEREVGRFRARNDS